MKHFKIGKFKPRPRFLPDDVYSYVRDSIVRGCVEALIMDKGQTKVLLGKRIIDPWPNWWTFGSRMVAGEDPRDAVSRTVKEDLNLNIPAKRFIFLDVVSLVFPRRQEPPKENGCHDLSLFYFLTISGAENSLIRMRKQEYGKTRWFDPEDVTKKAGFHLATVECLKLALKIKKG